MKTHRLSLALVALLASLSSGYIYADAGGTPPPTNGPRAANGLPSSANTAPNPSAPNGGNPAPPPTNSPPQAANGFPSSAATVPNPSAPPPVAPPPPVSSNGSPSSAAVSPNPSAPNGGNGQGSLPPH